MNKILAIIFLAALLILTQNIVSSYAAVSLNKAVIVEKSDYEDQTDKINNKENKNEDSDDDDNGNRVIAIILGATPAANVKPLPQIITKTRALLPSVSPTPIPTLAPKKTQMLNANFQSSGTTNNESHAQNPSPTETPQISSQSSQHEKSNETEVFNLINELEKLLSSLKRIIFATIS